MLRSVPPFNLDIPAIICGSAPCLATDLAAVGAWNSNLTIIAVNDAWREVRPDMLVGYEVESVLVHARGAAERWGRCFTTHAPAWPAATARDGIDHFWVDDTHDQSGTSTMFAVKIAKAIGFSPIILCGAPLLGGDGYIDGVEDDHGFGRVAPGSFEVNHAHNAWLRAREAGRLHGVYSMSGFTRDLLGLPPS